MAGSTIVDAPRRGGWAPVRVLAAVIFALAALHAERMAWRERARYRRALAQMSERELADIGVNWSEIANEAAKPFWRA
jgi:uncharacterized protein YjiS (DUF1127 family)